MKLDGLPAQILAKLLRLDEQAEALADQVHRSSDSISSGRARLQNGAAGLHQREHDDLLVSVRQAADEFPKLLAKRDNARQVAMSCKAWLQSLPDSTQLVLHEVDVDGHDLTSVRNRIRDLKDEHARLCKVPEPSPDIEARIKTYVASLARPRVSGIAANQKLEVSWPENAATLLAFIAPEMLIKATLAEVTRMANDPMPVAQRKQRMADLTDEIRELRYVEEKLIDATTEYVERSDIHAPAVLCAAIVRDDDTDSKKKVALERRERTSA